MMIYSAKNSKFLLGNINDYRLIFVIKVINSSNMINYDFFVNCCTLKLNEN